MYCSKCGARAPDDETLCGSCGAALQVNAGNAWPRPSVVVVPQVVYSGFWRRVMAGVVDFAVCAPFLYALEYAVGQTPFETPDWSPGYWTLQWVEIAIGWFYGALLESSRCQGTLGQQLLDVRVCDLSGRRVSFLRATGRHFAQYLSLFTLGIGFLMIAFTARKQALHDRLAGCLVVRRERETARTAPDPTSPGAPPRPPIVFSAPAPDPASPGGAPPAPGIGA